MMAGGKRKNFDVALFLLGNFACYVPLAMMTKMASLGLFASQNGRPTTSFEMLPLYSLGNIVVAIIFLSLAGWWRLAARTRIMGFNIPRPRWITLLSGICTIGQIFTVIWAYSFSGISLVFAALLMKGGVLIMAPLVDLITKNRKRTIYWPSLAASALSLFALIVASLDKFETALTLVCIFDISMYILAYMVKLAIMSRWAKSTDSHERRRYIAEEQIAISGGLIVLLIIMGSIGAVSSGPGIFKEVSNGFTVLPAMGFYVAPAFVGVMAICAGIFGSMVFLDRRENTFCAAAVQSTIIVAGTLATTLLAIFYARPYPSMNHIAGVLIVLCAIVLLSYRGRVEMRRLSYLEADQAAA